MTLEGLIKTIWRRYDKSTDYPVAGSEDYELITSYINDAIEAWADRAMEDNVRWRVLFTELSSASDGDKATTANVVSYLCPSDFVELAGEGITITDGGSVVYPFVDTSFVPHINLTESGRRYCYFTKSPVNGRWYLNINPVPTTSGNTINYFYYRSPKKLVNATDSTDIPKPYFIVYQVLSVLFEEERPDLASVYSAKAVSVLESMIVNNSMVPMLQGYKLEDISSITAGAVFGK